MKWPRWTLLILVILLVVSSKVDGYTNHHAQEFVETVYKLYANEQFSAVYDVLHPAIQGVISKADYVAFQTRQVEKLGLSILETNTSDPEVEVNLPKDIAPFFAAVGYEGVVLSVPISYRASFYMIGKLKQTRTVKKDVSVLFEEDSYHLLWDPSPVTEESDE